MTYQQAFEGLVEKLCEIEDIIEVRDYAYDLENKLLKTYEHKTSNRNKRG